MIWAVSNVITPKAGDTRTTVRYAYLPKRLMTKEGPVKIWLAQYERLEVYAVKSITAILQGEQKIFEIGEWVNVAEMPIKWTRA